MKNYKREKTWPSSNSIRETPSDSAQFDVICENPVRSDWWNSVISSVHAFSRDAPSLSFTIQHSCFTSLVVEHFLIHWLQTSILPGRIDGVVLWQIKWNPKDMKSKLSPSFTLSTPLESKRPTLPSAQLSPAWITGSDKVSQDFSVGIFQRTSETHLLRGRASATQQGHDWLDLCLDVCATFCPGIK